MEVRRAVGQGGVELSQIEWYKNDGVELIFLRWSAPKQALNFVRTITPKQA
jgi:hypothetical protein